MLEIKPASFFLSPRTTFKHISWTVSIVLFIEPHSVTYLNNKYFSDLQNVPQIFGQRKTTTKTDMHLRQHPIPGHAHCATVTHRVTVGLRQGYPTRHESPGVCWGCERRTLIPLLSALACDQTPCGVRTVVYLSESCLLLSPCCPGNVLPSVRLLFKRLHRPRLWLKS